MKKQEFFIAASLKCLGVSPSLLGYHYLKYGIELMMNDQSLINSITKTLYPTIAEHFNATTSSVERAIRHAIEVGWVRGDRKAQDDLFGYTVDVDKGKPTNCEFIATVADYLLMGEVNGGDING